MRVYGRRVGAALGGVLLVCCALLVLAVYQLINMSLELCPAAVTYSGLLAHSLGPGWCAQTDSIDRIDCSQDFASRFF